MGLGCLTLFDRIHYTITPLSVNVTHRVVCGTLRIMKMNVQARLDRQSQMALESLVRSLGWSPSRVVREGLNLLAACYRTPSRARIVGLGRYASGIPDLGSNKKNLRGFGQ